MNNAIPSGEIQPWDYNSWSGATKEGRKGSVRKFVYVGRWDRSRMVSIIAQFPISSSSPFLLCSKEEERRGGAWRKVSVEKMRERITRSTRFSLRKSSRPASREFRGNSTRRFTKLGTRDVVARDDFAGALLLIEK